MLDKYKPFIAAFFVLFVCSIAYSAHHYAQKYRATQLELDKATATIGTMQKQRADSAKLDKEHYDALQAKKNELADLQRCIAAGKCGVCSTNNSPSIRLPSAGQSDATGSNTILAGLTGSTGVAEDCAVTTLMLNQLQSDIEGQKGY